MDKHLRALLMSDYYAYVKFVQGAHYIPSRFHQYLCNIVQAFIEEKTEHAFDVLIISTPPQHGKSETITETLPSWFLGRNPDKSVIEVSYNADYAEKFGRRNRLKLEEYGEVFGLKLGTPNTNRNFEIQDHKGGMISCGILTGITGNPSHLMIIDDPVKNAQEAASESRREQISDEWLYSMRTRLAVGAKVIVILTRWHEDDIASRIIASEKNVRVLNLPVEAEENDPLGRQIGEPLCPEIGKGAKWLEDFKIGYMSKEGSRAFQTLFQGHPSALEGDLIKKEWWQHYTELPEIVDWVMSVDAAFKDSDDSDYVAIQVWGKTGASIYLIDAVKRHLNLPDTMREIIRLRNAYPLCKTTLIEDKANGSAVIDILRKEMTGIIPVQPRGGKESRVNAIIGAIESGNVYLPNKPFTGDFIDECSSFPNGKHDDQVDAMSQALNRLVYTKSYAKAPKKIDVIEKYFPASKRKKKKMDVGESINVV